MFICYSCQERKGIHIDNHEYRVYHKMHEQWDNSMHVRQEFNHYSVKSRFGEVIIVWLCIDKKIVRIFLPEQLNLFKSAEFNSSRVLRVGDDLMRSICVKVGRLLQGKPVRFCLDILDWSFTYPFQERVLRIENKIPRGMVSTYGRLASKLGHTGAARAVGTALARNPFPLVIPCHRAVRSDGSLGGYAGGLEMKRELLKLEGVRFDRRGRVAVKGFW